MAQVDDFFIDTNRVEKYYFAVADIVQVLTDSFDAKQHIKRMRARAPELNSRWGTICTPAEMLAPDSKRRKTQAADLEGYPSDDGASPWPFGSVTRTCFR